MFPTIVLIMLLLAWSAVATPALADRSPVTLPISRHLNLSSVHNLVRHDQNRAKSHKLKGSARARFNHRAVISEAIDNQAVSYVANIGIGSPPTTYSLIVDTGSSNTWVGAGKPYVKTSTSVQTTNKVSVTYGSGEFSGTEFTDTVIIAPSLVIPQQSIGVAAQSTGFNGVDGILGIGPVDLTVATLSPAVCTDIPTITDNLFSNGVINAHLVAISFEPTTVVETVNGEITWGGTDSSKFTGIIHFIPLTTTLPAAEFWGINQSVRYGVSTSILGTTAGIIDAGTTLILLATQGFNMYRSATGGVLDNNTGLLHLTPAQFSNLQSLFFVAGGATFELTANAQIWPRSLNTAIGGVASAIYLIVSDLGSDIGEGFDFVIGYTFMERFYTVFDTGNKRIGLATTPFTTATTN